MFTKTAQKVVDHVVCMVVELVLAPVSLHQAVRAPLPSELPCAWALADGHRAAGTFVPDVFPTVPCSPEEIPSANCHVNISFL